MGDFKWEMVVLAAAFIVFAIFPLAAAAEIFLLIRTNAPTAQLPYLIAVLLVMTLPLAVVTYLTVKRSRE